MTGQRKISVLVVDDSAVNRRALTLLLESAPDVEVLGRAVDGEEGLKKVLELRPDVITLDLEMPRLDGFSFLRLVMAHAPTPVVVVSSYAHQADVFKALDLGALDFIAKPRRPDREQLEELRRQLLDKVRAVSQWRPGPARRVTPSPSPIRAALPSIVAVGASTGGPTAIQQLLESLHGAPLCLLVCQHMPPRFTRAFAERLDRLGSFAVREARTGDQVQPRLALIAPGGRHLAVARKGDGLEVRVEPSVPSDKHAPSIDRLFSSVAEVLGDRSLGVVLTGMGADGALGARAIAAAGGQVWAEAEQTATIFGMPQEAIATGAVSRVLPLHEIGPALIKR